MENNWKTNIYIYLIIMYVRYYLFINNITQRLLTIISLYLKIKINEYGKHIEYVEKSMNDRKL